jgi:hypothetical protein
MINEQVISDEVLEMIDLAISRNENWMTYNNSLYFIGKEDIQFFKNRDIALEFMASNISDYDRHSLIHVQCLADVFRQIPYGAMFENQLNNSSSKNVSIMNEQNFEYLKDNLKYMGFGEKQNEALEQHLKEGKEAFQLTVNAEINQKAFEATLSFRKSESSDMYFFNSYQASLEKKNGDKVDQTFYLNRGKGVTAKEAFNLLDGRAVFKELANKEGQTYKAWVQLDFNNKDKSNNNEVKQFHENYGYDLKAEASKFAISELNDADKEKTLMQSLQKGNIQSVTIEKDGSVHKMFIEANPQYKTINLYDAQMKRVQKEDIGNYQNFVPTAQAVRKDDQAIKPENKQKNQKKNLPSEQNRLLPKKREKSKKGLNIS